MIGTLTLPVVDWDDSYIGSAPYVVVNTPGNPAPCLWDGHRWREMPDAILAAVTYPQATPAREVNQ